MIAPLALAAVLALGVLLAWARLLRGQLGRPFERRSPTWRLAVLLVAQPLLAGLLYFTLLPPAVGVPGATLVVATRGASLAPAVGGRAVALPEAPIAVGERVPDLGTALRRYPATDRLVIVGEGLTPRDRDAARGWTIELRPAAMPTGLVELTPPAPAAPGSVFRVTGRVEGVERGSVELADPAGARLDRVSLDSAGGFALAGTARVPGAARFELRVRSSTGALIERADIPVVVADAPPPRLLLLAGAPSPETKFLRRWAIDAGLNLNAQFALGGDLAIGDAPLSLDRRTFDRFDAVIIDERRWATLDPRERAALVAAVRGGLGLLLRVTGPVPEGTRRQWQALGMSVAGGVDVAKVALGSADGLTRRVVRLGARDGIALQLRPRSAALATWRAEGRGRVALWTLTDTYALALGGDGRRHAELWSDAVAVIARPRATRRARLEGLAWAGQRAVVCDAADRAPVAAPDRTTVRLILDPASGCSAFWPVRAGWHHVGEAATPLYVYPADALPAVRALETRRATQALAAQPLPQLTAPGPRQAGSSWPWFLAWLAAAGASWWFERAGRRAGA